MNNNKINKEADDDIKSFTGFILVKQVEDFSNNCILND